VHFLPVLTVVGLVLSEVELALHSDDPAGDLGVLHVDGVFSPFAGVEVVCLAVPEAAVLRLLTPTPLLAR
jgi:hypothetical protein